MPFEIVLLVLRTAIAIALYAFLGVLIYLLWQEIKTNNAPPSPDVTPSGFGKLIVVEADDIPLEVGQVFPLELVTTFGRARSNSVVLPDSFASSEHAAIVHKDDQWWLEDKDSHNGVTVNDVQIDHDVILTAGDIIGIGRTRLRFEP